jgi:hypothetical protein
MAPFVWLEPAMTKVVRGEIVYRGLAAIVMHDHRLGLPSSNDDLPARYTRYRVIVRMLENHPFGNFGGFRFRAAGSNHGWPDGGTPRSSGHSIDLGLKLWSSGFVVPNSVLKDWRVGSVRGMLSLAKHSGWATAQDTFPAVWLRNVKIGFCIKKQRLSGLFHMAWNQTQPISGTWDYMKRMHGSHVVTLDGADCAFYAYKAGFPFAAWDREEPVFDR